MSRLPKILLLSRTPAFFERSDVCFNRRGVDVFCAQSLLDALRIIRAQRIRLIVCGDVPPHVDGAGLRKTVPRHIPILILRTPPKEVMHPDTTHPADNCYVLDAPFGQRVGERVAQLLALPTRHYLRLLVHFQRTGADQPVSFGFTANLSTSGLLLDTRCSASIGEILELSFLLPSTRESTKVRGIVVRQNTSPERDTHQYGLKFLDLPTQSHETILDLGRKTARMGVIG